MGLPFNNDSYLSIIIIIINQLSRQLRLITALLLSHVVRIDLPWAAPTRGQEHNLPARGRGDIRGAALWDHETWVCDGTRPTVREGQSAMLPML